MAFCDFCPCETCREGEPWLTHALTTDGRWICDVCYEYDLCVLAAGLKGGSPCKESDCSHRPTIVGEWE